MQRQCSCATPSAEVQSRTCCPCANSRLPATVAEATSGNMVGEWLPQMRAPFTAPGDTPRRLAMAPTARFWSRRVSAEKFALGMDGACSAAIRALVQAGLPTTTTFTSLLETESSSAPARSKILALADSRSLRSMPGPRGRAPTSRATSTPVKASTSLLVATMRVTTEAAQSSISMTTAASLGMAGSISFRCSTTGWSLPSSSPRAIRKIKLYAIWPAAPVTSTVTGSLRSSFCRAREEAGRDGGLKLTRTTAE